MEKMNKLNIVNLSSSNNTLLKLKTHLKYDLVLSLKKDCIKTFFTHLNNRDLYNHFIKMIDLSKDRETLLYEMKNIEIGIN
jgi:hypothetical protein